MTMIWITSFVVGTLGLGLVFALLVLLGHGFMWLIPEENVPHKLWTPRAIGQSLRTLVSVVFVAFLALCFIVAATAFGALVLHGIL